MTTSTAAAPPLSRERAFDVATGELLAFLDLLGNLETHEWQLATDCTGWTVRDVVAHVAGAMESGARLTVLLRAFATAPRRYPGLSPLDAVNQAQVDDRAGAATDDLVAEIAVLGPRAARARRRMPGLLRNRVVPGRDNGLPPGATFRYLVDVIYPRDLWMHRIDVEQATGRPHAATRTEHDVVAEVVRDLATVWSGPATALSLTGPGGGAWQLGPGAATATLSADAVQTCRLLSGRDASPEVTVNGDPEAERHLLASRITF